MKPFSVVTYNSRQVIDLWSGLPYLLSTVTILSLVLHEKKLDLYYNNSDWTSGQNPELMKRGVIEHTENKRSG